MTAQAPEPSDAPGARRNGLAAERFAELLDVEERLVPGLLQALADAQVAAFAVPRGTSGVDRLHVDGERVDAARLVVERELRAEARRSGSTPVARDARPPSWRSSAGQADVDAAWEQIVASWEDAPAVRGDEGKTSSRRSRDDDVPARSRRSRWRRRAARPARQEGSSGAGGGTDAEEPTGWAPPPAPPVGRLSPQALVGVLAMAAGLLVVVWPGLVGLRPSAVTFSLGVLGLVGGAVALFLRLSDGPRRDDRPDDGAVL